jgi:predicted 3-demethylubiquinone-9 3-methyltransferase (glyoxalase superfamily)
MSKIAVFLWLNDKAEEAAKFYTSIFKKSKILKVARYPQAAAKQTGRPVGSVMTVEFKLDERRFVAFNGGPSFKFTEAISLVVNCKNQAELDRFWNVLSTGGEKRPCGWAKDKYGLSWQIVPAEIEKWLSSKDSARSQRVMEAVLRMSKLDFKTLKKAYGKSEG